MEMDGAVDGIVFPVLQQYLDIYRNTDFFCTVMNYILHPVDRD